jgi:hypothetical protein
MRRLCVSSLLFALAFVVSADNHAAVAIHGFDKMSCGDWTASRFNAVAREQYIAWIRGIVTGYNYGNPDEQVTSSQMPDDVSLALYVDGFCRDRPLISFVGAAFALIDELHAKPQKDAAPRAGDFDADAFQSWLKKQSVDMQSLDIDILRNIYKKESALGTK